MGPICRVGLPGLELVGLTEQELVELTEPQLVELATGHWKEVIGKFGIRAKWPKTYDTLRDATTRPGEHWGARQWDAETKLFRMVVKVLDTMRAENLPLPHGLHSCVGGRPADVRRVRGGCSDAVQQVPRLRHPW